MSTENGRVALGEFLNYCSVLSVDGTGMHPYDVPKLMRQIKRLTVDKAIKSGFDDESVYKSETGIVMDEKVFAVHGGSAINLVVRDLPRYSIDIDLTYIPLEEREDSLIHINDHLKKIEEGIRDFRRRGERFFGDDNNRTACQLAVSGAVGILRT